MSKFLEKEIQGKSPILQKIIRNVYNLKFDTSIFEWSKIRVSDSMFKDILRISDLVNSGKDITFEIGYRYFRNNKLVIEKGVFVPQHDTEQIIDIVLEKGIVKGQALEVGCGSGAISISLEEETDLGITSIDINPQAIELSKKNSIKKTAKFQISDFRLFKSDIFFDLIISNPPYIDIDDKYITDWVKTNQPFESLYSSDKGLAFYELIFRKANSLLSKQGYIILEIGYDQEKSVKDIAEKIYNVVEVIKDYAGYSRFIVAHNEV